MEETTARFWKRVNKNGPVPPHRQDLGPCWIWTGGKRRGYGRLVVNGKFVQASRISYELNVGPLSDDLDVCHHCDNPPCVNPLHLFTGTASDNAKDREDKGRRDVRGERHGRSKFVTADIVTIRRRRAAGESLAQLGRDYRVSSQSIRAIVTGRSWSHIREGIAA